MTIATNPSTPRRTRWSAIAAVGFAQLVVAGGSSVAALALPAIRTDLGITESLTAWVLLAYALPMGAVAIAAGRLADRADLRAVSVFAMGGLAVFSLVAAIAPNFTILVAARVVQGLTGGALFGMTGRIIVTSAVESQRGRALALITTLMTVGAMGSFTLGGFAVGAFGWRGIFWLFLVLGALALAALFATVPSNGTGLPRLDRAVVVEVATSGGAITAFLLAFEYLDRSLWIAAAAVVASVALAGLWAKQPSSGPTVALLRRPVMASALTSLTLMSAVMGLFNFSIPYLLADVHQVGPRTMSTVMLVFVAAIGVVAPISGLLADRFGAGRVAFVGAVASVAAMVPLLSVDAETGLVDLGVRIALLGLAFGVLNTPMNAFLLASAPPEQSGTAGAFMATTRTIGTSLGPVIAALAWGLASGGIAGYRLSAAAITGVLVLALIALAAGRPWRTAPS